MTDPLLSLDNSIEGDRAEQDRRRVCIINFTGERANWGCQSTSWELVRLINEYWYEDAPFELDVIPLLPRHALDQEIARKHLTSIRAALDTQSPTKPQMDEMLRLARLRYRHYVDVVEKADVVVFQAEGTMTGTEFHRAERMLLLPWIATHVFHKPVMALNGTMFSADSEFSQLLFKVLSSLNRIWVREDASLRWLRQNGFAKARLIPDTAFLTDPVDHGNLWKELPADQYFCVTGSAILRQAEMPDYLDAALAIAETTNLLPVFVCSTEKDLKLPALAKGRWPADRFRQISPDLIYPAVAHCLGQAQFLLGGRYQMSILAAISGTPSVLIESNTHKLEGLVETLGVAWRVRKPSQRTELVSDAKQLLSRAVNTRPELKARVNEIRLQIAAAFKKRHHESTTNRVAASLSSTVSPENADQFGQRNREVASQIQYTATDSPAAMLGASPSVLRQLMPMLVYLRRGWRTKETFLCFRQLIEGNLDLAIEQLDARWLVSVCDTYADFGDPLESRNALLISTFLNWERIATTYIDWAEPGRTTLNVKQPAPSRSSPLWDGLTTIHLSRGDTTSNMLRRIRQSLRSTPHLLRIWNALLSRIRENDSVMAALNRVHGHVFDEELKWMNDLPAAEVPPWRLT